MRINSCFIKRTILFLFIVAAAGACERLRPIYEIQGQAIPNTGTSLTLSQVEERIITAGASQGWLMKAVKPGVLRGTKRAGRHSAVVRIEYDTNSYDILYDSSQSLSEGIGSLETRYEGQRVIHKRYNKYVKVLNRQIETFLLSGGY